jgi:hypothetical protein
MTDAVQTFRGISWLIVKWILISIGALIVLIALTFGGTIAYRWLTYEWPASKVQLIISTTRKDCPDDKFPISVLIGNTSSKVVTKAEFTLEARVKGRSTNIVMYHRYMDDHVLEPEKGWANCWAVPTLSETVPEPRDLEWSVGTRDITFQ